MNNRIKLLIFGLAFAVSVLECGLVIAFGAVFSDIRETFESDRPTTATVQSLLMVITTCFSVVSGILINTFGLHIVILVSSILVSTGFAVSLFVTDIRHLYATISVLAGIGISMIYVSIVTLISKIFSGKRRALCLSIHTTCVPLAGIFYPYLLDLLTTAYGLSGTFLILGGVFCNAFVLSLLIWFRRCDLILQMEHATEERNRSGEQSQKQSLNKVLQFVKELMSKRFACLLVASGIAMAAVNGYLDFAFDIAEWKEYDRAQAKTLFVIYNIFCGFYSVMPGLLKQKLDIDIYFYLLGFALSGLFGSLMILFAKTYAMYAVRTACIGAIPGILSPAYIICAELVRPEQVGVAIGMLPTVIGLLTAGTGPLFGTIGDNSGSYNPVLTIIVSAQAIAVFLFFADIVLRRLKGMCGSINIRCD